MRNLCGRSRACSTTHAPWAGERCPPAWCVRAAVAGDMGVCVGCVPSDMRPCLLVCRSLDRVSQEWLCRAVLRAPRAPRAPPLAPRLPSVAHRAISRCIPSRPPSFPRLPSTHHFDRRAAPSPLPTPSSLRPLTTPSSSTRPRSAFGARRRRRLFLRLARLERVVPFGRVVKVRVCVCV